MDYRRQTQYISYDSLIQELQLHPLMITKMIIITELGFPDLVKIYV